MRCVTLLAYLAVHAGSTPVYAKSSAVMTGTAFLAFAVGSKQTAGFMPSELQSQTRVNLHCRLRTTVLLSKVGN